MVHALREIWRVLRPEGQLIDLRPRVANWPLDVIMDGQPVFAGLVDNTTFVADDTAAERAIGQAAREGWFSLAHRASFECASYWDTIENMITYYAESVTSPLVVPDDVLVKVHEITAHRHPHQSSKVRLRMRMDISRYNKRANTNV